MRLIGALLAFLLGAVISLAGYLLTARLLKKGDSFLLPAAFLRQILDVGTLTALFFLIPYTPFDRRFVLIGAALGMTLPMVLFTVRQLRYSRKSDGSGNDGNSDKE